MKSFAKIILVLCVVTALVVWFVPGADTFVEALTQQLVGGLARN